MICFALCLVSFITRGLQNNDHSNFACCLAHISIKKKTSSENCVRLFKILLKVQVSVHRLKFLRKCLKNDIIPDFLKFRVPDNGVFWNQAVNNFQLKLLRSEISRANEDMNRYEEMLMKARSLVQKKVDEQWWASIFRFVRRQFEASLKSTSENHRKQIKKLSERQDKPLGVRNERSVKVLDNIELPDGYMKCYQWARSIPFDTN